MGSQVALLEGQLVLTRLVRQLALGEDGAAVAPPAPAAPRPRYGLRLQGPSPLPPAERAG